MPEQPSSTDDALAVVILAAGAGTRMKSKTPKVLQSIAGRSMLAHAMHAAAAIEPEQLVVVVGHQAELVTAAATAVAGDLKLPLATPLQPEQNGTGHAVECGLSAVPDAFTGTVIVTAADVPLLDADTLRALAAAHALPPHAAISVLTTTAPDPTGYGRIVRDGAGEVAAIVEQADATAAEQQIAEVNSGVYAFDAVFLRKALTELSVDNAQGELYLTDAVKIARDAGLHVRAQHIDDAYLVAGANDKVQLAALGAELNQRIVEGWMRAGVTIIDPATTIIDVDVRLERDVILHPGTQLHGATVIAEDAVVGPDTTLTDVQVGERASVIRTHGSQAVISADATVGPFAYLRPGTVLGTAGKIGAFVETKNAVIGHGSKVPHLTYVGDATIGEHSNIGASCVFVNYDGVSKHHTVIGSYVRAGSDTMFVAPLNIGDGAYTAAGTVVRKDVPAGALAITSGTQRNLDGWVEKRWPDTKSAAAARLAQANEQMANEHDNEDGENS
ncbi:bifunctional UDP-N-acetylglucosamine diphosphorylase/glucosamine-1-phosphate N-acetyltransferase GlmU [Tomitella biformata]|uniref:bifunctional UDP-N-acetylglucosamine diphosphorylase/glucosamine-1-phosphate N-acetyltransferase GlmU n=1 Tax=Tomitella biformata TaxID=630403 RepID=UPI000464CB2B|nr:bifunctional UDP-N-acetylglucosamine diphosphorylase/glucosamine-1-phosphate N-acetyltransferase GlmU [Tomitella biformata]